MQICTRQTPNPRYVRPLPFPIAYLSCRNLHSNGCSMVGNSVIGYSMQLSNNTQPKQEASFEQFANSFQNNMMMNYGMGMMGGMGGMGQGMMMNPPAVVMPRNETEIAKIKEEAENAFCMVRNIGV